MSDAGVVVDHTYTIASESDEEERLKDIGNSVRDPREQRAETKRALLQMYPDSRTSIAAMEHILASTDVETSVLDIGWDLDLAQEKW